MANVSQKADVSKARWNLGAALAAWAGVITAEAGYVVRITHWPAYKALMQEIRSAIDDLTTAVNAVQGFRQGGVNAFISAVVNDEGEKVRQKQRKLDLLLANNSAEQKAIRDARADSTQISTTSG